LLMLEKNSFLETNISCEKGKKKEDTHNTRNCGI
jgi:hypothetical protein